MSEESKSAHALFEVVRLPCSDVISMVVENIFIDQSILLCEDMEQAVFVLPRAHTVAQAHILVHPAFALHVCGDFTTLKSPKHSTWNWPPPGSEISRTEPKPFSSCVPSSSHSSRVVSARPQQPHFHPIPPAPRCSLTEIIEVARWWEVNEALPTHSWPFPSPCANHCGTVFWTFLNERL